MRVVQIIDSLEVGGKERQLIELLKGLGQRQDIVSVLIVMSEDVHYQEVKQLGVEIFRLPRRTRYDAGMYWRLLKLLLKLCPDIVQSWNPMCSVYAGPLAKICGARFVNAFIRDAPAANSWRNPIYFWGRLMMLFSDVVVANSFAGLVSYRIPSGRGVFIHNGFDQERVANLPEPATICRDLDITTPHIVGMVGSFSDLKDYDTFLRAGAQMSEQRGDVTFVAVGDGANFEQYKRAYPKSQFPRIRLLGRRTDVEAIVNTFTIGVLASAAIHGEGISNSIMEYMALGKPVVATDSGGNRELIEEGKTGTIVPIGDIDQLISGVLRFINNSDLASEMGRNGRKRLYEEFSLEKMTGAYIQLYEDIAANRCHYR